MTVESVTEHDVLHLQPSELMGCIALTDDAFRTCRERVYQFGD